MSLEFLVKVLLIKRSFLFLSKALGKERLPTFPKTGSLWKHTPISIALFIIPFGVSSKGALPQQKSHSISESFLRYPRAIMTAEIPHFLTRSSPAVTLQPVTLFKAERTKQERVRKRSMVALSKLISLNWRGRNEKNHELPADERCSNPGGLRSSPPNATTCPLWTSWSYLLGMAGV